MSPIERLVAVSAPFVSLVAEAKDVATDVLGWQDSGLVVRAIRGAKTRTLSSLFDEFSAALQFPYYFGENWAAFADCVSDLDWLPVRSGVVVVVYDADQVLVDEHAGDMSTLVQTLIRASDEFAEVVNDGEWWDRDPVPFHVVLQVRSDRELERWRQAGAAPEELI